MYPSTPNDQPKEPTAEDRAGFPSQRRDNDDRHPARRTDGRRRGGQPGNQNARKYGFYTKSYQRREANDLDAVKNNALMDEIALIRVFMRRVAMLAKGIDDPYFNADVLRVLCLAGTTLSRLIRAQTEVSDSTGDERIDAFIAALQKAFKEPDPVDEDAHPPHSVDLSRPDVSGDSSETTLPVEPLPPDDANLPTSQPSNPESATDDRSVNPSQPSTDNPPQPSTGDSFVPLRFLSQNDSPNPVNEVEPTHSRLTETLRAADEPPPE